MKNTFLRLIPLLAAFLMTSCGDDEKFEIKGEVIGNPSMNLYMRYYGNEKVMQGVTAVKNGKFEFFGVSKQPTIVEILDNDYHAMGRVYIANGQSLELKLNRHNPYKISIVGNKINEDWSKAINQNADSLFIGTSEYVNNWIEDFIGKNPANVVSTLLFLTSYDASVDPFRADSVLQSIDPDARIGRMLDGYATIAARFSGEEGRCVIDSLRYRTLDNDTMRIFEAGKSKSTLIVLTNDKSDRKITIVPKLKKIAEDHKKEDFRILDLMLCSDTVAWRNTVKNDSAKWVQGWMPGGIFADGLDKMTIPSLPYFIIIDSLGNQLHRTADPAIIERKLAH